MAGEGSAAQGRGGGPRLGPSRERNGTRRDRTRAPQKRRARRRRWLRRWGCRHLRLADSEFSADALQVWWNRWGSSLPSRDQDLTGTDLVTPGVIEAYKSLASMPAAHRTYGDRDVDVRFGDTAAAKTLFALRPRAFPPWDEPIRLAFGARAFDGSSYAMFLRSAAAALEGAARRLGVGVGDLPKLLGRPSSTPAKIVDEYLWMRVTRELGPPADDAVQPFVG
jgi:hypothetical protein